MAKIKKNYLVKKRNVLNEMRAKDMTLQELRFLSIYLSKINKDDPSTRCVRFSLDDFQAIMDIVRLDMAHIKKVTDTLLSRVVSVPIENDAGKFIGYNSFQLFKGCKVMTDGSTGAYVEIDAHDEALPLMFLYKEKYLTYRLSNALRVKSPNQIRMYEILKQYEKIGSRILSVEELRRQIGIDEKEYPRFGDFKVRVLDGCQKALAKYTDIKYTYEPYGSRGKAGKILYLRFFVQKNEVEQITLPEFIEQYKADDDGGKLSDYDKKMIFLSDACDNEFSIPEIVVFYDLMVEQLPHETVRDDLNCYDYLMRKYRYMNMQNSIHKILHRNAYMRSIIGKDDEPPVKPQKSKKGKYDTDKIERLEREELKDAIGIDGE